MTYNLSLTVLHKQLGMLEQFISTASCLVHVSRELYLAGSLWAVSGIGEGQGCHIGGWQLAPPDTRGNMPLNSKGV